LAPYSPFSRAVVSFVGCAANALRAKAREGVCAHLLMIADQRRVRRWTIGLRLHPAYPGAPFYQLSAGSSASREMLRPGLRHRVRHHRARFRALGTGCRAPTRGARLGLDGSAFAVMIPSTLGWSRISRNSANSQRNSEWASISNAWRGAGSRAFLTRSTSWPRQQCRTAAFWSTRFICRERGDHCTTCVALQPASSVTRCVLG
jgi:hypothetical protein